MSSKLGIAKKFLKEGADLGIRCLSDAKSRWEVEDSLHIEDVVTPLMANGSPDLELLESKVREQINQAEHTWQTLQSRF